MRYEDLTGRRFGRLIVLERTDSHIKKNGDKQTAFLCRCDCGNVRKVLAYNLKNGHTLSCGCLSFEHRTKARTKHGETGTRLYRIWHHMKERCNDNKNARFTDYGGRGIKVCNEWQCSYETFREWATSNGYTDMLTLDRKNNNDGYCPENCRWVTAKEQANNTRKNRLITYKNITHTLAEWSDIVKIKPSTIANRINSGWTIEDALFKPLRGEKNATS